MFIVLPKPKSIIMKHLFTLVGRMLIISILLCSGGMAYAQDLNVSGKVTDASNGSPLIGATVYVKGTTNGTATNLDGMYSISVPKGSTLVFSSVGYATQEITVTEATLNVVLAVSTEQLQEVVVIGYGTVKKSDVTGSITTVGPKDFNKGAITSPQELLMGKAAGVVVEAPTGAPGAGSTIRIRGGSSLNASNDPLIVIDGVPIDNTGISGVSNPLSTINPNDIESFTVLKDASATAIYGNRASNGVIIITTKKGVAGQGLKISYNGNASVSIAPKMLDVLSGDQLRNLAFELNGTNNINAAAFNQLGSANTDWQKEIYRTAISHDHNISLTNSYKNMPYRTSLGYTDQAGILKNTDMKRYTMTLGLNPKFLDDHLSVDINGNGSYTENNFGESGAIGAATSFDPTQPIMNGNSRFAGYTTWTETPFGINSNENQLATANPVAMIDLTKNKSFVYRGIANAKIDYKFHWMPDLHATLNVAIDAYKSTGHNNVDTTAAWTRRSGYGRLDNFNQKGYNKLLDFYLNYTKNLDPIKSKIDITGGYSWQHFYKEGGNYSRSIVAPGHPLVVADSSAYKTENYLVSFFGRMNYTFMDRYVVTATIRDDGSSRFAPKNHWGLFPAVAFMWKIKNEFFLKDVQFVSDLKLRLGWGKTGQQNITNNDYPYLGTYRTADVSSYYQFGNSWIPTLRPNAYDPDIKWETTTTKNIGIDFGFFSDRITGSVDYYKRVTDNLISFIPIPNGSNFSNYLLTNVGSLENNGVEVSLNLRPISTQDMAWNIGLNMSYNQNKITKLLRTEDPTYIGIAAGGISGGTGNNIQMQSVGYPINSFFVLQQVYGTNGMPIEGLYVDRSGEGGNVSGNLHNFYHYKKPAPDYVIGISSRFNYKQFDFSFSGRLSLGNYVYNNVASQTFYGNLYNNNFWQNLNSQINNTKFNNAQYMSDFYVENASFFRMDNITLGYSFNKLFTDKLKGRVSFTVQNAFVITKYKGLDPEVDGGIDNNAYPRPRVFLLGVNFDI